MWIDYPEHYVPLKLKRISMHTSTNSALLNRCTYLAYAELYRLSPEHEGKVITGSDTISSIAKRKQIKDFEKETGSPSHWNPAQFGGSPAYLLKFGRENSVLNLVIADYERH